MMRLNKYLASCGVASRRKADMLISSGQVSVNGQPVYILGTSIDEHKDKVEVDGKGVGLSRNKVYILLNKLPGYVTTKSDPQGRKTVFALLPALKERLFSVGRLDYDAGGLLILTNDGELANRLMHPRYEVPKTYHVWVKGKVSPESLQKLVTGLTLPDGPAKAEQARLLKQSYQDSLIELVLKEGKKREVKHLCEGIGHPVKSLVRVALGSLKLGNLEPGKWRRLSPREVQGLKDASK